MVGVSAMPGGVSRESDIPIDWVDDDELNAIESAFEAIPKRAKIHPGSPRSLPTASSPMRVSALSALVPIPRVHGGFTQRTSSSASQRGWPGQNANSADLNLAMGSPGRGELGLGQNGIRASNLSHLLGSSSGCAARSQYSDGFQPVNGGLQPIQAGLDVIISADVSEAGSDSLTVSEFREEVATPREESPAADRVEIDGGKESLERPAEGRRVRQLPAWMQATSSSPQLLLNAGVAAERSKMLIDNERRAAEAVSPDSVSTERDHPSQPLPWRMPLSIQQSSFVDNVKPQFPIMQFRGQIVYSKTESEVHTASLEVLQRIREMQEARPEAGSVAIPIGFDVEWRANFERGELPNRVAVLQLCLDSRRCDVMQIVHSGMPPSLKNVLEDPSTIKVGVGIHADAHKLLTDWSTRTRNVEDLRKIAQRKLKCSKDWSLASMAFHLTGKQIDKNKSIRCGDWEALPLSAPQLLYAATDAFAGVHLYQILSNFPNAETKRKGSANACGRETPSTFPNPETKGQGSANATGQEIVSTVLDSETNGPGYTNASGQETTSSHTNPETEGKGSTNATGQEILSTILESETKGQGSANATGQEILSTILESETKGQGSANATGQEILSTILESETKGQGSANATGQEILSTILESETKGQGSTNASGQETLSTFPNLETKAPGSVNASDQPPG